MRYKSTVRGNAIKCLLHVTYKIKMSCCYQLGHALRVPMCGMFGFCGVLRFDVTVRDFDCRNSWRYNCRWPGVSDSACYRVLVCGTAQKQVKVIEY